MANTYSSTFYAEAKQACLDLGLQPNLGSTRRILKTGASTIKNMNNYFDRREITDIEKKPYTNEFGEQEPFGDICDRNLEYAERFVEKHMDRFQGGVKNMTEASLFVMRKQREQIKKLSEQ